VLDKGNEDSRVKVEVEIPGVKTLSTEDGSLTELRGVVCAGSLDTPSEGTGPLPVGGQHRFIWNSDHDLDRLVCEGLLTEPRVVGKKATIRISAVAPSGCLESAPVVKSYFLDNTLLHTVAGILPGQTPPGEPGIPAEDMTFDTLSGAAMAKNEELMFFVDSGKHQLWRMNLREEPAILERLGGLGLRRILEPASTFDRQPAATALLNDPRNMQVSDAGIVYFTEEEGNTLWSIDEAGILSLLMDHAVLDNPRNFVLSEGEGEIYLADTDNCRVIRYDLKKPKNRASPPGRVIVGDLRVLMPRQDGFGDISFTRSELLENDVNGCNYRCVRARLDSKNLTICPPETLLPERILDRPEGVALYKNDKGRYLFISSTSSNRVRRVLLDHDDPASTLTTVLDEGRFSRLCSPGFLSVLEVLDGHPHLYIVCWSVTARPSGPLRAVKGILVKAAIVDDPVDGPVLRDPVIVAGMRQDRNDADCGVTNLASNYLPSHECLPATDVPLSNPANVFEDSRGNLYICDARNQRIRKLSNDDGLCTIRIPCQPPEQVPERGRLMTLVGGSSEGFEASPCEVVADDLCGPPDFEVEEAAVASKLSQPLGMVLVDEETLYFSVRGNSLVKRFDLRSGVVATVAGRDHKCVGDTQETGSFAGDGMPAREALLNEPRGLAVFPPNGFCGAKDRKLYVVDSSVFASESTIACD
jgi:hypothetical protein